MTRDTAGNRVWSPKGRPKSRARNHGYSHAEGGVATSYPAFGAFTGSAKALLRVFSLFAVCLTVAGVSVAQVTAPGTVIRNAGSIAYEEAGLARTIESNEVALAVEPLPSRASIGLARYEASASSVSAAGPTQCRVGDAFVPLAPPAPQGVGVLDPMTPIPLQETTVAHAGDPVFVRVADADRNRDASVVDTVDVRLTARSTGDVEILRLSETGPNTGVFVGYVPTLTNAAASDCALQVERNADLEVTYVDPADSTDAVQASALVDPYGLVFDSQTGGPIDGARVRLIDANTGLPANVFGDDGVSRYPNEMVTGQAVTDEGGTQYLLPPGVFRFPLVAPGNYRLEVIPPGTHSFPSQRTIPELQTLPGAPFELQPGSYGQTFVVTAAPAVAVDLPLDPGAGVLQLRKTAGQQIATTGDFVQYTLTLENTSTTGAIVDIDIVDRMPAGARYRPGSLRLDGVRIADPELAADGRTFTYRHASLGAGQSITLRYVVEFTIAMRGMKDAVNTAQAFAPGDARSNEARALVRLNEELFSQKGFIVGRVFEGGCDSDGRKAAGVANVRIYLEDGRYGVTDDDGHFHFEGLDPGTHVVQLDQFTLPEYLELAPCTDRMGHAGRSYSQFAEIRPGTLWRSDFVLKQKSAPTGGVGFAFGTALPADPDGEGLALHEATLDVQGVPTGNTRVMVMLPPGIEYVPGSATLDGAKVTDSGAQVIGAGAAVVSVADGMLTARLGEVAPGTVRTFRFGTRASSGNGGEYVVRALALFDSPSKSGQRTAPVEVRLARGANAPLTLVEGGGQAGRIETQGVILRGPSAGNGKKLPRRAEPVDKLGMGVVLDVERLQPGIAWLAPRADASPEISVTKVAIQHLPGQTVEVTVNGKPVDPLAFDGVALNAANTVAMSRWRAVELVDGENQLVARVLDASGAEVWSSQRSVHFGGGPVRAVLDKAASKLVADGRTRPVIALRMFDKYGKPARAGMLAGFRVDSPYRSWWEVEQLDDNQILSVGPREPQVEVQQNGLALIELEPTTTAGHAVIRVRFNERQSDEFKVWLEPAARDWILVGIAEGTAAYHRISGNMETASAADREEGFEQDGRVAFFAKGRIRGDFLLTMAYDSARRKEEARNRLHGTIQPDQYYLLYGDATEQRFEAATQSKLYLKIERRQFVALFGDFDTGFTVTELTKYNRSLSGVRSDYAGERFSVSGFAARTDTGLVQDEIQGDGTSGLYRLSRAPIVIGSDKLRIEVRDRFEITRVVESRELARFIDYDLDYERGTVFFKEPVQSRDRDLNPVFIVVDYEVRNGGEEQTSAGLRVAAKLAGEKLELGASAVHEGSEDGDTGIVGADLDWRPTGNTRVRAEIAQSQSDDPLKPESSTAWLVEGKHVSEHVEARAWAREVEAGFGVGQQLTADTGTRGVGVDARYKFTEQLVVSGEVQHQTVLASDATRLLASADVRVLRDTWSVGGGARHVADEDSDGDEKVSDQAFVTGSVDVWDRRVTLRGEADVTIGGKDQSVDYPARSIVGIDYHLTDQTTLYAEYERATGDQLEADTTRFGMRARPWERTQVNSSINTQATEYGPRTFANFGLTQGFVYKDRWAFDVGFDQSNTLRGPDLEPFHPNAPLASGSLTEDFLAAFVGAAYRHELWQMTSRLEHRDSDNEERWSSTTGWYREPVEGHAMSVSLQAFTSDATLGESTEAVGRFAWAFRPDSSRWIVFNRFELKYDEQSGQGESNESARVVNNLHGNWQLNPSLQVGLQYGVRYVSSTFDGDTYSGVSDIAGFDLRRQLTPRFDLGVHAAVLHSWESDVMDHSTGIDVGMTVAKNLWISVGYNFAGFRDADFSASRHTAQGPYLSIRMKADQDTFKDLNLDSLRPSR